MRVWSTSFCISDVISAFCVVVAIRIGSERSTKKIDLIADTSEGMKSISQIKNVSPKLCLAEQSNSPEIEVVRILNNIYGD